MSNPQEPQTPLTECLVNPIKLENLPAELVTEMFKLARGDSNAFEINGSMEMRGGKKKAAAPGSCNGPQLVVTFKRVFSPRTSATCHFPRVTLTQSSEETDFTFTVINKKLRGIASYVESKIVPVFYIGNVVELIRDLNSVPRRLLMDPYCKYRRVKHLAIDLAPLLELMERDQAAAVTAAANIYGRRDSEAVTAFMKGTQRMLSLFPQLAHIELIAPILLKRTVLRGQLSTGYKMPIGRTPEEAKRLIQNGTYGDLHAEERKLLARAEDARDRFKDVCSAIDGGRDCVEIRINRWLAS